MKNLSMYRYTVLGMLAVVLLMFLATVASAHVVRSETVKRQFMKTHICPSTGLYKLPCKNFVLDHVVPLACGGKDVVSNLQLQTVVAAKAKDKWERIGCKGGKRITPAGAPA